MAIINILIQIEMFSCDSYENKTWNHHETTH